MKKAFQTPLAALAPLSLILAAGCARMGTNFSVDRTLGIRPGMSKLEVQRVMGWPNIISSVVIGGQNMETWTWTYSAVTRVVFIGYKGRANSFTIAFDKNGAVADAPRSLVNASGWGVFFNKGTVIYESGSQAPGGDKTDANNATVSAHFKF